MLRLSTMLMSAQVVFVLVAIFGRLSCADGTPKETDSQRRQDRTPRAWPFVQSSDMAEMTYGFLACVVTIVFYGSNLVPVKKIDTGDGMFYQWVFCAAIWMVGLVGDLCLKSPHVHPIAMLGGAIWATGNITAVPVVKFLGLGLGVLLWGSSGLLVGWASSRFGWFGINAEVVSKPVLNYCGAGLCLLSAFIFFFVKSDVQTSVLSDATPLLIDKRPNPDGQGSSDSWVDTITPKSKRLIGFTLAILSGVLYGTSFVPVLYIKNHAATNNSVFTGASQYDLDYCFAQYNGIFLASTVYFLIYCVVMKNRPRIYPRAILPGLVAGLMWGIATYCWFMANNYLGAVITFPIVTAGYGLVAALWGSLVFKEVKGLANCLIFTLAACVVLTGSLMTAFSKV